jgi:RNA polymerase-binding transcription factor DksA
MALDPQILAELKEKLLQEKVRINDELGRIATKDSAGEYITTFEDIGTGEDENATEVKDYTDNLALESTLEKQLNEVLEALDRMEKDTYGKCENCGTDIPIDRLKAYPSAKTCIKCL